MVWNYLQCFSVFICQHISAVGSYRETMCELASDILLSSDTTIIVDSRESAMKEAGEIVQSKVRIDVYFLEFRKYLMFLFSSGKNNRWIRWIDIEWEVRSRCID